MEDAPRLAARFFGLETRGAIISFLTIYFTTTIPRIFGLPLTAFSREIFV
jgi:hypothetical protein